MCICRCPYPQSLLSRSELLPFDPQSVSARCSATRTKHGVRAPSIRTLATSTPAREHPDVAEAPHEQHRPLLLEASIVESAFGSEESPMPLVLPAIRNGEAPPRSFGSSRRVEVLQALCKCFGRYRMDQMMIDQPQRLVYVKPLVSKPGGLRGNRSSRRLPHTRRALHVRR